MKSYLKVSFKERNDDDNSDMSKNSRRVYCRDTTVRKTIFSFSKRFEKMVFPKKIGPEHGLSRIIRKDDISFSQKHIFYIDGK